MDQNAPELPEITITPEQITVKLDKGQTQTQTMTLKNLSVDASLTYILGVSDVETAPRATVGAVHGLPQLNMHRAMDGAMHRLKNPSIRALQGQANLTASPKNYLLVGQDGGEPNVKVDLDRVYFQYDPVRKKLVFKVKTAQPWGEDLALGICIDSDSNPTTGMLGFEHFLSVSMDKGKVLGALFSYTPQAKDPNFPFEITKVLTQEDLNLIPHATVCEIGIPLNALQHTPATLTFSLVMQEKSSDTDFDIAPNLGDYVVPLWLTAFDASGVVQPKQQTNITLNFDGIVGGTHHATLQVMGDKTGESLKLVPLNFIVQVDETRIQVWPGDTDNDGAVTAADIIPLGVHWKKVGPKRNAPIKWEAQLALPWDPEAATYADADGNGIVDAADVLIMCSQYQRSALSPQRLKPNQTPHLKLRCKLKTSIMSLRLQAIFSSIQGALKSWR